MLAHFVFRLQRLLDLREQAVKESQKRLAIAMGAVLDAQAELHCFQVERQELQASWQTAIVGGMWPEMAVSYQRCFGNLDHECQRASTKIAATQKEELACRALLDKALRQQKVLEKLRDRTKARLVLETNRREQAELDEFSVLRQAQEAR